MKIVASIIDNNVPVVIIEKLTDGNYSFYLIENEDGYTFFSPQGTTTEPENYELCIDRFLRDGYDYRVYPTPIDFKEGEHFVFEDD